MGKIYTLCSLAVLLPALCQADEAHRHTDDGPSIPIRIGQAASVDDALSIGQPHEGALAYGVALRGSEQLTVRQGRNYGTVELVGLIEAAAAKVGRDHPGTPKLYVGDLSLKHGGAMRPHVSHQSGLDADIGYYLKRGHATDRLKGANRKTLDVPRTYTFMETLLESGDVQYVFSDKDIIKALRVYARDTVGLPAAKVSAWFGEQGKRAIVRHLKGHSSHLHLRVKGSASKATLAQVQEAGLRTKLRTRMHPKGSSQDLPDQTEMAMTANSDVPDDTVGKSVSTARPTPSKAPVSKRPHSSLQEISLAISNGGRRPITRARSRVNTARLRAQVARSRAKRVRRRLRHRRRHGMKAPSAAPQAPQSSPNSDARIARY